MKKLFLFMLVLMVFAISSYAESTWRPALYAGGGASIPTGNFKNAFKTGFNAEGGVGVEYRSMFEIIGEAFYSRFPLNQTKFLATQPAGTSVSGGAAKILNIDAALKYYIPTGQGMKSFKPYLLGRLGAAHLTQANMTLSNNGKSVTNSFAGSTKFTYGIGAGTNIEVNQNLAVWVEGRFTGINTSVRKTNYVPIQVGIRYLFGKE